MTDDVREIAYQLAKKYSKIPVTKFAIEETDIMYQKHSMFQVYYAQQAFIKYLLEKNKMFEYNIYSVNSKSNDDFYLIYKDNSKQLINIRPMPYPKTWFMLITKDRADVLQKKSKLKDVLLIGVRHLSKTEEAIEGFCTLAECDFEAEGKGFNKKGIPTYYAHISKLHDIAILLNQLQEGQGIVNYGL